MPANATIPSATAEAASTKRCSSCHEFKPLAEFHRDRGKRDGRGGYCKQCSGRRDALRRLENPTFSRDYSRQKATGVEAEFIERLLAFQKGVCAVTGQTEATGKSLSLDHYHGREGQPRSVRGLILNSVNRAIGYFDDDPKEMRRVAGMIDADPAGRPSGLLARQNKGLGIIEWNPATLRAMAKYLEWYERVMTAKDDEGNEADLDIVTIARLGLTTD